MGLVFNVIQDVPHVLEIQISVFLVWPIPIEFKLTEHALVLLDSMTLDKLIVLLALFLV